MILPAAYAQEATHVLQWEHFHYDSQFSIFQPQMSPLNIICVKGKWKELSSITKFISSFKVAAKFGIFKRFRLNPCGLCCAATVVCQNGTLSIL